MEIQTETLPTLGPNSDYAFLLRRFYYDLGRIAIDVVFVCSAVQILSYFSNHLKTAAEVL